MLPAQLSQCDNLLFFIVAQDIAHADGAYTARRFQCPERYLSLAGFEVTFIGRFWVTAEDFPVLPARILNPPHRICSTERA